MALVGLVRMIRMAFEVLQVRTPYVHIHSIIFRKRNGVNIMTIISREKGRVKQYQYRVYFTDVFGNRKQRNSKWYDTQKECKDAEALFLIKSQEKKNIRY